MTADERRPVTDNEARAINAQPWEPLPGMVKLRRDPVIVVGASLGDQGGEISRPLTAASPHATSSRS